MSIDIEAMPFDLLKRLAMELPFNDIQHYCNTSKRFRQICSDPYFWKALYERDYLEDSDYPRPVEDYRGLYLYLTGKDLVYQGLVIEGDYNYEGSIGNIVDRILNRDDIAQDLQRQIDRRRQEIFEEVDKDLEKASSLRKQGTRLLNNTLRKRPPRYFPIPDPEAFAGLRSSVPDGTRSIPVWSVIDDLGYHGYDPDLRDGDLIGIYQNEDADLTQLPDMIIYIFRDEDGQLNATQSGRTILPHRLLEEIKTKGVTAAAITEQYKLPFDISDIDK